jgi:uncharacterized protein (DUF2132 family)
MTSSGDKVADPMQGVTLKMIVTRLEERYGWQELGKLIRINCFTSDPSISSSLKFLRRTPWAREKVEALYVATDWQVTNSSVNADIWGK